jgi:hypothetical protein
MKKLSITILLSFLFFNWTLEKDEQYLRIYSKPSLNGLKAYKANTIVNKNILDLSLFLLEIHNHCKWIYRCIKSTKPETYSTNHFYIYYQFNAPWPIQNREILADTIFNIDINNNKVFISITMNVLEGAPIDKNFFRIQKGKITLNLKEISYNETDVEFIYDIDPAASNIEHTIINIYNYIITYNTIKNLKSILENSSK